MQVYRTADGEEKIWLEKSEIESTIEDELKKAALYPTLDNPVVDLERFIERHLGAKLDPYADLESDVLGMTEFPKRKPPRVLINRDLTGFALDDEEPGQLGRWRATIAHEGSHIVFHRFLFELSDMNQPLFPVEGATTATNSRLMRCLKRDVSFIARTRDWREIQANLGMAALLMPQKLFLRVAEERAAALGVAYGTNSEDPMSKTLVTDLGSIFQTSRQATAIRLETLGVLSPPGHPTLNVS